MRSSRTCWASLLLCLAALWLAAAPAWAALAIDSQESGGIGHNSLTAAGATSSTGLSWPFTNTAGDLLVVFVFLESTNSAGGANPTASVTYGGNAMTAVPGTPYGWFTAGAGVADSIFAFYLTAPPTGANTVAVSTTFAGNAGNVNGYDQIGMAISLRGANQAAPTGTAATATDQTGTSAATSVSVTGTLASSIVLDGVQTGTHVASANSPTTQSALLNVSTISAGDNAAIGDQSGSGTQTASWSVTADVWGTLAFEVFAAGGARTRTLLGVGQ